MSEHILGGFQTEYRCKCSQQRRRHGRTSQRFITLSLEGNNTFTEKGVMLGFG